MTNENPELLTMLEVVKIARIGKSTLYTAVAKGTFPMPRKIGRRSLWVLSEVMEWMLKLPNATIGTNATNRNKTVDNI